MKLKPGVRILGIKTETAFAINVCDSVYREYGYNMTVTSVVEGKHSRASLHYAGMAFDLRISDLRPESVPIIHQELKNALGQDFDVVLESDHFHCEFQPKEPL